MSSGKMATSRAIMVAETVKKDVVYSAQCFDQKPLDSSTQLVVEYSVMALEQRFSAPLDTHDTIRYIDGAIDVISGCLAIGAFAFPPAAPVLAGIAAVGAAIKFFMKLIPDDRPDPVLAKYKELETAINELEKQMDIHFADMQNFMTEHNFNVNITTQASTLMRYMKNCLKHQDEIDLENFKEEYERNSPLSTAYYLKSFLENRSTNPLIMAMAAEKVKTKATFNKWKSIILGILGEYLFIETFASGLLEKSDFNSKQIAKQYEELEQTLNSWEDGYKEDQEYWKELKEDFEKYFEKSTHLNNIQKGEALKERIDNYLTHDAFYICVMNETTWDKDYTYYCPNEKDQLIGAWRKGKCNAFVYRSRKGSRMSKESYENLRMQIRKSEDKLFWNNGLKNILRDQLASPSLISNCGFYCLLGTMHCDPQIYYLNAPGTGWLNKGPGNLEVMWLKEKGGSPQGEYSFIVAFS